MSNFEILAVGYAFSILLTILAAVAYLAAEFKGAGGVKNYYSIRSYEDYRLALVSSIVMIVVISWIMTPIATILCRSTWLHNYDYDPYF